MKNRGKNMHQNLVRKNINNHDNLYQSIQSLKILITFNAISNPNTTLTHADFSQIGSIFK